MILTQKMIKTRLKKWIKGHFYLEDNRDKDKFWYVQNAIGDIISWPKWYGKFIKEISNGKM